VLRRRRAAPVRHRVDRPTFDAVSRVVAGGVAAPPTPHPSPTSKRLVRHAGAVHVGMLPISEKKEPPEIPARFTVPGTTINDQVRVDESAEPDYAAKLGPT
jgi:hypothetical protein